MYERKFQQLFFLSQVFTSNRNEWSPSNDWGSFINIYWTYILFQTPVEHRHALRCDKIIDCAHWPFRSVDKQSTMSRGKSDWMTDRVYMCESRREWMKFSFVVHKIWCYCYCTYERVRELPRAWRQKSIKWSIYSFIITVLDIWADGKIIFYRIMFEAKNIYRRPWWKMKGNQS
jgi:hypothetical protein